MSSSRAKAVEALVAQASANEGSHALFGTSIEEIAAYMVIEFDMEPEEAIEAIERAANGGVLVGGRVFDIASAVLEHSRTGADL